MENPKRERGGGGSQREDCQDEKQAEKSQKQQHRQPVTICFSENTKQTYFSGFTYIHTEKHRAIKLRNDREIARQTTLRLQDAVVQVLESPQIKISSNLKMAHETTHRLLPTVSKCMHAHP